MDPHLRRIAEPAHPLPRRGDTDARVEHRRDQRDDPGQRPPLIVAITGCGRTLLEPPRQPVQLPIRHLRIRPRGSPGCQSPSATSDPDPPPLIRRLRRHLQPRRDLDRRQPPLEQISRGPPDLPPLPAFHLADTTTIAVTHTTSRTDHTKLRRSPKSLTKDPTETLTTKGV